MYVYFLSVKLRIYIFICNMICRQIIYIARERGEGREREGEKREILVVFLKGFFNIY